jgi:hypothetical protein
MRVYRGKGNCDLLNRSDFPPIGLKEPPGNYSSGGSFGSKIYSLFTVYCLPVTV